VGGDAAMNPLALVIDNYDSFTFNLVQHMAQMNVEIVVKRHDSLSVDDAADMRPDYIVISPGPKGPEDAGISVDLVRRLGPRIPILGVCLGHQCIARAFGAAIVKDRKIFHGKTSLVRHDGETLFRNIANPLTAARYHSLVVEQESLPACLQVSARTEDGVIMGLRHENFPVEGLQFHPESFLTPQGFSILNNFLEHHAPSRTARGDRRGERRSS